MGLKPNMTLLKQGLRIAQGHESSHPVNASFRAFAGLGIGRINGRQYLIGRDDRAAMRGWLKQQGIEWQMSPARLTGSRLEISAFTVDEKVSLETVGGKRVLISALGDGVTVNGSPSPSMPGAYVSIAMAAIADCDARGVLLVENLAVFQAVHVLKGSIPRNGWLAVFRGAPQDPLGQQWASRFVQEKQIPLITCSDFDPAGLEIALGAGSQALVLPELESIHGLKGNTGDYQAQFEQWLRMRQHPVVTSVLGPWLDYLAASKAGFTQERMMRHGATMTTIWLDGASGDHESED